MKNNTTILTPTRYRIKWNLFQITIVKEVDGYAVSDTGYAYNWNDIEIVTTTH